LYSGSLPGIKRRVVAITTYPLLARRLRMDCSCTIPPPPICACTSMSWSNLYPIYFCL